VSKLILQVEQEEQKILNIQRVQQEDPQTAEFLKTVEQTLQSRTLLERVLDTNNLARDARFAERESGQRPLTREQLAELLASLGIESLKGPEFAAALHRHSGGNPLFALETLRHAWAQTALAGQPLPRPVNVTRIIERRVMGLSPAAIRIARCAAVAGTDFSIDLAAQVLASPVIDLADAWSELEHAQVFVDGASAHDLIFEAVRASLPQAIARHLHGEVARHLEQRSHAPPAAIAEHWLAAQAVERALPFLHRAGAAAAAQRRFAEAAVTYEREARLRLQCGDA